MSETTKAPSGQVNHVAGSFQYAAQLPNGKSLSFSGYIVEGDTLADINMKMDVAAEAIERQRMKAEVPELESKLDNLKHTLTQVNTIIEDLSSGRKLSSQEQQQLNTMKVNRKSIEAQIDEGTAAVARAKKVA